MQFFYDFFTVMLINKTINYKICHFFVIGYQDYESTLITKFLLQVNMYYSYTLK